MFDMELRDTISLKLRKYEVSGAVRVLNNVGKFLSNRRQLVFINGVSSGLRKGSPRRP